MHQIYNESGLLRKIVLGVKHLTDNASKKTFFKEVMHPLSHLLTWLHTPSSSSSLICIQLSNKEWYASHALLIGKDFITTSNISLSRLILYPSPYKIYFFISEQYYMLIGSWSNPPFNKIYHKNITNCNNLLCYWFNQCCSFPYTLCSLKRSRKYLFSRIELKTFCTQS